MDWWIAFAIFLYLSCAGLLIAEVFVPSGGILSIIALGCLIGGVAIFFKHSILVGWIGIAMAILIIPSTVIFSYKIFPKTRFGKAVTLIPPNRSEGDAIPDTKQLTKLLGTTGHVLSPLRPVGTCDFAGQRLECIAESGYIEKDQKVRVIEVHSTRVTVRLIDKD